MCTTFDERWKITKGRLSRTALPARGMGRGYFRSMHMKGLEKRQVYSQMRQMQVQFQVVDQGPGTKLKCSVIARGIFRFPSPSRMRKSESESL